MQPSSICIIVGLFIVDNDPGTFLHTPVIYVYLDRVTTVLLKNYNFISIWWTKYGTVLVPYGFHSTIWWTKWPPFFHNP